MTVGLAFDADPAADKLTEQVRALGAAEVSRDRPPIGRDWNEYLQHLEREHVRALALSRGLYHFVPAAPPTRGAIVGFQPPRQPPR